MSIAARNAMLAGGAAPGPTPAYWGLCFTAEEPNCVVNMARRGALASINKAPVTLEYSTDDCETWTEFDATGEKTTPITLANIGDHVFFRAGEGGNDRFAYNASAFRYFTLTGNVAASGDIMSLLDASNHSNYSLSGHSAFALAYLFRGCTSLTTAPSLPATTLASSCYYQMFYGCTSLTTAPSLPATTLADSCYRQMFYGCTSLVAAPSLPATTLAGSCYSQMFSGCTSLVAAPSLPATSLAGSCYSHMFYGCTSLASIRIGSTGWRTGATHSWVYNVAASGTFYCPTALGTDATITRSADYCPEGWTVINTDA